MPQPTIYRSNVPGASYVDAELVIYNQTLYWGTERADSIKVRIIPVGALFNGGFEYSPFAVHDTTSASSISGTELVIKKQSSSGSISRIIGNFDKGGGTCDFAFGYSKYKIEFYKTKFNDSTNFYSDWEYVNYVYVDYRDAGNNNLPPIYGGSQDIRIDYFTKDTITFQHHPSADNYPLYTFRYWNINLVNNNIEMWKLFGTCLNQLVPDKSLFVPDSSHGNTFLKWPINANIFNGNIGHENPGEIGMNLLVNHNVTTWDTLKDTITNINITNKSELTILANDTLDLITPVSPP
nr:hypothetical protein [Ignavibacteria bacterium]